MHNDLATTRNALRLELRARRRALTPAQQIEAALRLVRQLVKLPQILRAQHIALYIANDGEINTEVLAQQLWKMKKQLYLPVMRPKMRELWFVRYDASTPLTPNRVGILEPDHRTQHKLIPSLLDVVLLPLVGFDGSGARLGMGGGFYDATFAFKQKSTKGRPYLVGLAHSCQQVDALPSEAWDIPLYAIATDTSLLKVG